MKLRALACGIASVVIPLPLTINGWLPTTEDEYGVDHFDIPHFMLLATACLLLGSLCGAYAALRLSKLWWLAVLFNLVVLAALAAGGNNF